MPHPLPIVLPQTSHKYVLVFDFLQQEPLASFLPRLLFFLNFRALSSRPVPAPAFHPWVYVLFFSSRPFLTSLFPDGNWFSLFTFPKLVPVEYSKNRHSCFPFQPSHSSTVSHHLSFPQPSAPCFTLVCYPASCILPPRTPSPIPSIFPGFPPNPSNGRDTPLSACAVLVQNFS